jgi:hypothetical protein
MGGMFRAHQHGLVAEKDPVARIQSTHLMEQRPPVHPSQAPLLLLQRAAGNAAVCQLLESGSRPLAEAVSVQRCGPIPCNCSSSEKLEADHAGRSDVLDREQSALDPHPVQRTLSSDSTAMPIVQACPQGKQTKVVHDDCATGGPADRANFIRHLEVSIAGQTVTATWGARGRGKPSTQTDVWECSPRPGATPVGRDVVGVKCSIDHTNMKKDGMAWFTGFASTGLRIGFHDSQPVGRGIYSHGCVRVRCAHAATINANTWSGVTTINVK